MAGLRLPLHGRNHRHTGSDPIPNMLQWGGNVDTEVLGLDLNSAGGYFSTETGGGGYSIDTGDGAGHAALYQVDAGDILIRSHYGNDLDLESLNGGGVIVGTANGDMSFSTAGGNVSFDLTGALDGDFSYDGADFDVNAGTAEYRLRHLQFKATLVDANSQILFDCDGLYRVVSANGDVVLTAGSSVEITAAGDVHVTLAAGKAMTVMDHLANPLFRVDEDGDLHGLTGKALTFDL